MSFDPWMWAILLLALGVMLAMAEIMLPAGGALGALGLIAAAASIGIGYYHYGAVGGVSMFLASGVAAPAAIGLALWLLPRTPLGRQLLLGDPTADKDETDYSPEALRSRRELVGQIGVACNLMLPSGVVEIDGRTYDATTDAEAIDRGEPIRVVEVEAGRLLVHKYEGGDFEAQMDADDPLARPIADLGLQEFDDPNENDTPDAP